MQQVTKEVREALVGNTKNPSAGLYARAETIARTELQSATHDARTRQYGEQGVKLVQWVATEDERTCEWCGARHLNVYELGEAEIPAHPNCLVGGALVLAEGVSNYSKRWYEGPVVRIRTRRGYDLTCTPNHPILTRRGWVEAGLLNEGDDVISSSGAHWVALGGVDDDYAVARIEEVVDALIQSPEMTPTPVPLSPEDFHGDGVGSEVAIIGADSHLREGYDAALEQQIVQRALLWAAEFAFSLNGLRGLYLSIQGNSPPTSRFMGFTNLPLPFSRRHAFPLELFGLALASRLYIGAPQPGVNDVSRHLEMFGETVDRFSSFEALDDFLVRQPQPSVGLDARVVENGGDAGLSAPVDFAQLADGLPVPVAADDVVSVERRGFSGHVYNLQTKRGFYLAEGIITHNCRCTAVPFRRNWTEEGLIDVERDAEKPERG